MNLTINVTREHIDNGLRGNCGKCPIALAMVDAGFSGPEVDAYDLFGKRDGKYLLAFTPQPAYVFLTDFDKGKPVSPFAFEADFT